MPLACLLFGAAAWHCADRDIFIGWDQSTRKRNLQGLTNNTRFLIPPWVVVPHLLPPFGGAQPGRLLWASTLGGAAMLLAADIAVRIILPDRDLKLGVVTALIGAPLFLHLIYRTRREGV